MSWFGDVLNFEGFNLKNIGDKISKNPEQLLLGAGDPFSAGVWSKITGKDYQPLVNQWGGATDDTYQKAEALGINTGPGKKMHGLAQGIAGLFAGNYGAGKLGGLLGQGGSGAGTVGNAGYGNYTDPSWFNQANQSIPMGSGGGGWQSTLQNGWSSLKGGLNSANEYVKPISEGVGYAQQAQGLLGGQRQQMQPAQLPQYQDLSGLLSTAQQNPQLAQLQAQRMKRRGLLGGNYG